MSMPPKLRVDGKKRSFNFQKLTILWFEKPDGFVNFNFVFSLIFSLEWSPVHKSAKFWRENALRLNEKNYDLLRTLIHFLEVSKDPLVLAVASYDIGEYVRHNPRGKQWV